jgi:hypothetical protein
VPDAEPSRSLLAPVVRPRLGASRLQDEEGSATGRDRMRGEPLVRGRILRTGGSPQVLHHVIVSMVIMFILCEIFTGLYKHTFSV